VIVTLKQGVSEQEISEVISFLSLETAIHTTVIDDKKVLITLKDLGKEITDKLSNIIESSVLTHGVEYPLVSKHHKEKTIVKVKDVSIGEDLVMMAGPCSVESVEQFNEIAEGLSKVGVKILRGGAFKPRTSPYRFQGLGLEGLKIMKETAERLNMLVVTEVLDSTLIDTVYPYADILQIGSRNMQNYHFLKLLGKLDKPILLKRGMYSTIEEWLMAAEYILLGGNQNVILCERGIRTFDTIVRNTLDINAIPLVKSMSHLPIIVDPSHGSGRRDLVTKLSLAAVAAGADGLLVEVHNNPTQALSDGIQSMYLSDFENFNARVQSLYINLK
jgi:3-deoxy-7-phosphoheptulonate synthase